MTGHPGEHPSDEVLTLLARSDTPDLPPHVSQCPDCRTRLHTWQVLGEALRTDAVNVAPPSFDVLLGPALLAGGEGRRAVHPAGPRQEALVTSRSGRLPFRPAFVLQLFAQQMTLMPVRWAALNAAGFLTAALLASTHVQISLGARFFGAVTVLLMLFGALLVASPRRDPRRELLFTLPVSPTAVFLTRLTLVLGIDLLLAVGCSALVGGPGWWPVVSGWLGHALLATSLALALSVRFGPAAGATAGGVLWLFGAVRGAFSTPADAVVDVIASTTPWTLLAAAALLGWAVRSMRTIV
ncbi:hypothetical protein AB0O22_09320 [Streptomyces sp. NPDC091204]|uniref:hypothetical protein n=1 Tax=Streptomyces sp. NPDC091204 TaxID=3155299 RepID=UPI00343957BB